MRCNPEDYIIELSGILIKNLMSSRFKPLTEFRKAEDKFDTAKKLFDSGEMTKNEFKSYRKEYDKALETLTDGVKSLP